MAIKSDAADHLTTIIVSCKAHNTWKSKPKSEQVSGKGLGKDCPLPMLLLQLTHMSLRFQAVGNDNSQDVWLYRLVCWMIFLVMCLILAHYIKLIEHLSIGCLPKLILRFQCCYSSWGCSGNFVITKFFSHSLLLLILILINKLS